MEELIVHEKFHSLFKTESITIESVSNEILHLLSHQKLHVRFIEISLSKSEINKNWIKIAPELLHEYPIPKLIDNFLMEKNRNKME